MGQMRIALGVRADSVQFPPDTDRVSVLFDQILCLIENSCCPRTRKGKAAVLGARLSRPPRR